MATRLPRRWSALVLIGCVVGCVLLGLGRGQHGIRSCAGQSLEEEQREQVQVVDHTVMESFDARAVDPARVRELLVQKTNEFRSRHDLGAVETDSDLQKAAEYFAGYMAETDRYGHTADDQRPSQRAKKHGYRPCIVLENIASAFRSEGFSEERLAKVFVQGWIESPEHRRNLLDPAVSESGMAIARSKNTGTYYAVQMLGRPRSEAIRFSIANRASEVVRYRLDERTLELPPQFSRTHWVCRPTEVTLLGKEPQPAAEDGKQPPEGQPGQGQPGQGQPGQGQPGGHSEKEQPPAREVIEPSRGDEFVVFDEGGQLQVRRK